MRIYWFTPSQSIGPSVPILLLGLLSSLIGNSSVGYTGLNLWFTLVTAFAVPLNDWSSIVDYANSLYTIYIYIYTERHPTCMLECDNM